MTFLIVDDHRINLLLLENLLELYPIKILRASNGDEAFELWNRNKIDVLLTDHYMPIMDGLELIEKIKNTQLQSTLCVLITGDQNIHSPLIDRIFIKPIKKIEFDLFMQNLNSTYD